jgi:hypothetical protein
VLLLSALAATSQSQLQDEQLFEREAATGALAVGLLARAMERDEGVRAIGELRR